MAHPDLDKLFDTLFGFTQTLLSKNEEFHPWGAVMSPSGEIRWVGADNGEAFPEGQALIDLMTESFARDAKLGALRAAGICADVRVVPPGKHDKTDAVRCSLEHIHGEAVDVFVPYVKNKSGVTYGETFCWLREPQFFHPHPTQ